ncbi:DUF982 domain-containing protein [Peteryoungia desertarenae]|uniref:DUF982 domain-containing protein n=1 Tax=Peteryoungia desertarenae TaxID=1813451 RepID=A0ABX6QJX7_9HYPH|nr:DUF982 domain-containing protein [Peteryoungia desertarenae]QLF68410.1 DUF982 domain-containing protein [Peteryoungia desertarenae]
MTEDEFNWAKPVELTLPSGITRRFCNAYDALDFLDAEWPTRRGAAYERAIRLCRNALRSDKAAELSRIGFIAAAMEAGLEQADPQADLPRFSPRRRAVA